MTRSWVELVKSNLILKWNEEKASKSKEETALKVTYKGFTGTIYELKRETKPIIINVSPETSNLSARTDYYHLSILDEEKDAVINFHHVDIKDVTFSGVSVSLN